MKINSKEELLENSAVKLKVTIPKAEVKKEYEALIDEYCKKIAMKGFRKGKVPAEVLMRKFGDSIKAETTQNLIEKGLQEIFEKIDYKPLPYSVPELQDGENLKLDLDRPFSFEVKYDTFPRIELGEYKGFEVKEPVVVIGKSDMDRELAAIAEQNAIVVDKKEGKVEKGDTVTIDYMEVDEGGGELPATKREGFTFTVGSGYNLHKIDDDILGMARDEERVINKEYPEDFEIKELAGRSIRLKVKVTALKEKKLPEIDDELAQDVSEKYSTLKDMKDDISRRLDEAAESRLREANVGEILKRVVSNSKVPLAESMVHQELSIRWGNFVRQFKTDEKVILKMLDQQGKTKEDLLNEWRPGVEEAIRTRLVENKLVEVEKIEVADEEVDAEITKDAESQNKTLEEVKSEYNKNNLLGYIRENIITRKLYDLLIDNSTIKKGEKVKFLDFMQGKR